MGDSIEVWDIDAGSQKGQLSFKFPNTIRHPAFSTDLSMVACSQRGPTILDLSAIVPMNLTQQSRPDIPSTTATSTVANNSSLERNIQETRIVNSLQAEQNITKPDIDLNAIANIDPLKEPNAVKKRVEQFHGLDQEMNSIVQQSDTEITEWINGVEDITPDIVRTIYENIGAEYEFVKKQAEEEMANKTTTVLDGVMLYRGERFSKIVEKIQEEQMRRDVLESRRGSRTRRSTTRRRTDTRDGGYGSYNDGRMYQGTTRRSGRRRTRDDMTTSRPTPTKVTMKLPFTDPNTVKAEIKIYEGLDKELKTIDRLGIREMRGWVTKLGTTSPMLAKAVYQQVAAELNFTRKIAIEEKAAKTTVVIDGLLVNRNERLDALSKRMVEEKRRIRREESRTTSRTRTRR
jgi:hypothetical protein